MPQQRTFPYGLRYKKMRKRNITRRVRAGGLDIGGGAPVSIQSMANIPVERVPEIIEQVRRLDRLGCQLVRVALRSVEAVESLAKVLPAVPVPLCADIHFDYRIALAAIKAGVHKVRINPGNIGDERDSGVPIRIGVNGGSVNRRRYPEVTPESLAASALEHVKILEDNNFSDIVVSMKSSDIIHTIEANRIFVSQRDYPVHIGLTEAGYGTTCIVQSSVALGCLLMEGIGDTLRVSMTGDPTEEIIVARTILESVGERKARIRIISCPTCGRTDTGLDILELARTVDREATARFEKIMRDKDRTLHVAIMGCEVNGPGEARDADAGLAGIRDGRLLLFAKGEKVRVVNQHEAVAALMDELQKIIDMDFR